MTLQEIREEAWARAREITTIDEDRLWSLAEMNAYINRVYRQIAKETLCIRDATTPEVCLITSSVVDYATLTEGTLDYIWANNEDSCLYQVDVCPYLFDLHEKIITIDEVKWAGRAWKLIKVSSSKWQENTRWEQTLGMPTEFSTDLTVGKIAVNLRDTTSDTLQLQVRRLPLVDLVKDTDVPEFRTSYHDYLIHGVLWHMYSKQDSEAFDKVMVDKHYAQFLLDIDQIKQEETLLERRLRPNNSLSAFR